MNNFRPIIHLSLRFFILLGLAFYIIYLLTTGQLQYYIAPRMHVWISWSAVLLLLLATYQFYKLLGEVLRFFPSLNRDESNQTDRTETAILACGCDLDGPDFGHEHNHDHGHHHDHHHDHIPRSVTWRHGVGYGLLLVPILAWLLLPEVALSGDIAAKKGMILSGNVQVAEKREEALQELENDGASEDALEAKSGKQAGAGNGGAKGEEGVSLGDGKMLFGGADGVPGFVSLGEFDRDFAKFSAYIYKRDVIQIEESKFMEYLTAIDLYRQQFKGKQVEISGFVYRNENLQANQFVVGRLAVQCCSADAAPYGLLVDFVNAKSFADNSWVRVVGVVDETKLDGEEVLLLRVREAAAIAEPRQQYVYPNYDFMAETQ